MHDAPGTIGLVAERVEEGAIVERPDRSLVEHRSLDLVGQDHAGVEVADAEGVEVGAVVVFLPRIEASIGRNRAAAKGKSRIARGAFVQVDHDHLFARRGGRE